MFDDDIKGGKLADIILMKKTIINNLSKLMGKLYKEFLSCDTPRESEANFSITITLFINLLRVDPC